MFCGVFWVECDDLGTVLGGLSNEWVGKGTASDGCSWHQLIGILMVLVGVLVAAILANCIVGHGRWVESGALRLLTGASEEDKCNDNQEHDEDD